MKRVDIKNRSGVVIYTHIEENNTIRKTLEKAMEEGADFRGAIYFRMGNILRPNKRIPIW